MRDDIKQGLSAELRFALKDGWKFKFEDGRFLVSVPATEDRNSVRVEVWRIAALVAYAEFASVSRLPDGSYQLMSRDTSGEGYEIDFV